MKTLHFDTPYQFTEALEQRENFHRNYYLTHPNLNWNQPFTEHEFMQIISSPDFPGQKEYTWMNIKPDSNMISDNLLDSMKIDIFGMTMPNYIPLYMHWHTYFEII